MYFDNDGDSRNVPDRLLRAHRLFKLWCEAEKKSCTLKNFTRANLHFTKASAFPYLGGKGADVTVVLMFLEWFLKMLVRAPKSGDEIILSAMLQLVQGTLNFLGVMHSHDLFLPNGCAGYMAKQGLVALRSYSYCAKVAMEDSHRLFCLRPKFHYWAHTIYELRESYYQGHKQVLNPCIFNCEANEDFIGRVSRLSRRVSARLPIKRSLQRYGLGFVSRIRKLKRARR